MVPPLLYRKYPFKVKSQGEQQEPREAAEVPGVVVEAVAGRQPQADGVGLLQLQEHAAGQGGVAAVVVEAKAEEDGPGVVVQVQAHVPFEVVGG